MLTQLIIIQVITFVAIVFVLRKLLYTETAKETKRLYALKEENSRLQKELQQKVDAADKVYRESVAKAEEEARRLKARAAEDAEKTRAEGVENAKLEAERIVKAAAGAKDKIREEITVEKTREAPKLALRIFKETLSEKAKAVIHEELVKEVAGRIKGIEKSRFSVKVKKGELASAFSLKKDDRDAILAAVFDRLGERIPFEDKEESGLIAGIVVKLGSLIIDGSLVNRLKQVGEGLGKE